MAEVEKKNVHVPGSSLQSNGPSGPDSLTDLSLLFWILKLSMCDVAFRRFPTPLMPNSWDAYRLLNRHSTFEGVCLKFGKGAEAERARLEMQKLAYQARLANLDNVDDETITEEHSKLAEKYMSSQRCFPEQSLIDLFDNKSLEVLKSVSAWAKLACLDILCHNSQITPFRFVDLDDYLKKWSMYDTDSKSGESKTQKLQHIVRDSVKSVACTLSETNQSILRQFVHDTCLGLPATAVVEIIWHKMCDIHKV